MQISPSQVVVQLASTSFGSAEMPVFSISTSPSPSGQAGTVQISALARAMAGVAPVGATPQLNLAVQYVGSFGTGSSLSFTPFSPAAAAADRYSVIDSDPGEAARTAAADAAAEKLAAEQVAAGAAQQAEPIPLAASLPAAPAPAPVASAAYASTASAAPAPAATTVDVSV
ncbi:hypothetical protein [Pseudomarimonas salicorniae]|uniref:Uncharacterized protein n=1 Tax=Pseudomarimonas salicorniae TaxID=2933270 RepID=A0ABT0GE77_9GAMM|nr:hypothetical protein [Lysobacter sp. CAU 1642]MCK7592831.1 hypothetical protein [Lysobacter sp. CAU 1642]